MQASLIAWGQQSAFAREVLMNTGRAVGYVNQQTQTIFYPTANTTFSQRLWASTQIGGGAVLAAALVVEAFTGTLTAAATATMQQAGAYCVAYSALCARVLLGSVPTTVAAGKAVEEAKAAAPAIESESVALLQEAETAVGGGGQSLIYRTATGNANSLTPRPGIDDIPGGGLSFYDSLERLKPGSGKYVGVDPMLLKSCR